MKDKIAPPVPRVKYSGLRDYASVCAEMREFTLQREVQTADEFWILEHTPVYTQGQAGRSEHILNPGAIPIVKSDRGGQVTYHGPGQLIIYTLIDIRRLGIGIRHLVSNLEAGVIALLEDLDLVGHRVEGAPGVYVGEEKIAALGLRIRSGCSYHGIAVNVNMDLSPFDGINPCGYSGLKVTQLRNFGITLDVYDIAELLLGNLYSIMGLTPPDTGDQIRASI
jgi:lipoyl(octanoyl) transferase